MKYICLSIAAVLLLAASTQAQTWSPLGNGVGNTVNALTVYNGNLIAGGFFSGYFPDENYIAIVDLVK